MRCAQEQQREWEQRQSDLARVQSRCEQLLVAGRPNPNPSHQLSLSQSPSLSLSHSYSLSHSQSQSAQLERLSRLVQQRSTQLARTFALLGYALVFTFTFTFTSTSVFM